MKQESSESSVENILEPYSFCVSDTDNFHNLASSLSPFPLIRYCWDSFFLNEYISL